MKRDELDDIHSHLVADAKRQPVYANDTETALYGYSEGAEHALDVVRLKGYVKPYLVTTSTELEALPNHSVIVDKDADIWQKRGDKWCSYETNPHIDVRLLKYSPLTVIHEGGAA